MPLPIPACSGLIEQAAQTHRFGLIAKSCIGKSAQIT